MFDLITGREQHLPSHATAPITLSTLAQATLIGIVALIPVLFVSERLPEVPTMMAFVAVPAVPPPPPPPVAVKPKQTPPKAQAAAATNQFVAPLEEPARIQALPDDEGADFGVPGGVEGGMPGGVVGGVVGGGGKSRAPMVLFAHRSQRNSRAAHPHRHLVVFPETTEVERRGHGQSRYRYAEDRVGLQVEPPRLPARRDR